MWANMKAKFKDKELKPLLFSAARASHPVKLSQWLDELEKKNSAARDWVRERPYEQWARAVFKTFAKCDIVLNNISEYFNKYILEARERPLLTMMEMIRS